MLGKSEMMLSHRDHFTAADLKMRVFRKIERGASVQGRLAGMVDGDGAGPPLTQADRVSRDAALDLGPHAQIIVSRRGALVFANLPARALFGIAPESVGRPLHDFELSQQPIELRGPVDEAIRERRRVGLGEQRFVPAQGRRARARRDRGAAAARRRSGAWREHRVRGREPLRRHAA